MNDLDKTSNTLYITFPIRDALRPELGWTHYRLIMRVNNEKTRNFYIDLNVRT